MTPGISADFALHATKGNDKHLAEEAVSILLGAVWTLGLFVGLAWFERAQPADLKPDVEDIHMASVPPDPPPPKPQEQVLDPQVTAPITGIEIAHTDNQVKIAVVPPDLDKLIPPSELPPRATIQFSQLLTDLKPKAGADFDYQHIFQQNEVDQAPRAIVKTIARVTKNMRGESSELRATLLLIVETDGQVSSIKVIRSSSNKQFDKAVMECVRDEWEFSPAVRKGKKVRCMVQQLIWYKWLDEGDPFAL
jgi:TonB family protein